MREQPTPRPKRTVKSSRPEDKIASVGQDLEDRITRFDQPSRRELRRLARSSKRFAELIYVFPGAAFAIASRRGPVRQRREALVMIEDGAPLRSVAQALDLPFWLRRLPPEAFRGKLKNLPRGEHFTRRVSARLPGRSADSSFWLDTLAFGSEAANDDFALWLCEQNLTFERGTPERMFPVLAAYAWYSQAFSTQGHELIVVPWRREIALDTALCAAKSWWNRIRLVLQLEPGVITDTWLESGRAMGLEFVPLIEQSEILLEAHLMQNCADQYSDRIARDKCRLFSIRRNNTRLATMEVGPHHRETGILAITQLKARHNMPASIEIWQAAHAWLAGQSGLKHLPPVLAPERPLNARVWTTIMEPYRRAKFGASWMPRQPTLHAFSRIDNDLTELARKAGVSSWLFT